MEEPTRKELLEELADLRLRLKEAEDTLSAIRHGEVDTPVVPGPAGDKGFTLKGADHFCRVLMETMNEGVATLSRGGKILYANCRLADLLQTPLEKVIGSLIHDYVSPQDQPRFEAWLQWRQEENRGEFRLRAANGVEVPTMLSVSLLPPEDLPDKLCLVVTELTEPKGQEEILEAGRLSRAILEQVEQAIVVLNDQGVITQASQAAHRLYGGNLLLQQFAEAFPLRVQVQGSGAHFPEEGFPLAAVLQGAIYQGVEAVFPRLDGRGFHVILNAGPFQDVTGEVRGCLVSLTDITARKQAEEALSTQAQILESMAEGVTVTDHRGYILYTNPAFDAMFGYEPGELVSQHSNLLNYYPPEENLRIVQEILRQLKLSGVWLGEFHNCKKDGEPFFTSARISALEVGGKKLFISVQEDITERKHQQEMLRRQAELLDLAQDAILVRDLAGRITYWNRGAEKLYGWSREEAMGETAHRLLATKFPAPPVDIETLVMEQGHWEGELVHTTRDGCRLMVASRWSLKRDKQGRPLAILEINHDITAHRQAEEALSRSEQRFRKLVEANIIGIAVSDEETVVEANDAFLQMLGYNREELYTGEINWVELTPHEYLSQDAQALYELRTTGAHTPFEKAFLRKNGSQVSVMVGGALLEEEPLIWVSFVLDISDRKQLEAALRQSEARFRGIFSNASIGIATTDLKGYFQQFNAPVVKGLGYTPTELRNMSFFEITYPEDIDKDADLFAELAAGKRERYQVEKRYVRKDGRVLWGRLHVSLARNLAGEPEFAVSLVEDITARQEAQAALAESEARYRSLVEMSPDAIIVHARGRVIFANQAGLNLFGAESPEEILGQHILDLVPPEFQEIVKRRVKRGYAGERADLREIKIRRFDGRVLDVESSATPITYQGQPAVQVVVRDITERKQTEQELRRLASFPELNPYPVMEVDEEGQVLYANPAARQAAANLGLPEGVKAFLPPDLKEIFATVREGGPRGYSFDREFGEAVYVVTLHLPHDLPTARLYAMDITERQRAEEALQKSEARERARAIELQAILDATPGVILLTRDPEGRVITGNRAAYELMRRSPGSNLSKSALEGERPENFRTMQDGREITGAELPVQRAAAGETVRNFELDMVFDDGAVRHVLGDAVPLLDEAGHPRGAVAAFQDITERKQAEEALRQSEARYRAIGELIPYGIWTAGPDGSWDYVSKSFLKMTGKNLKECQGFDWMYLLPFEDIKPTLKAWQDCLATGSFWDYEYKIRSKGGSYRTILSRGLPLADDQGRITSWVGLNLDITERKEMEEALRRVQVALEDRVAQRTAALRLANEQLMWEIEERQKAEDRLRQSEARFTAFMQYLPGVAVMRDIQGRYLFANEAWERLTGQKQGEWLKKTVEDIWSPDVAKTVKDSDFNILSTGQPAEHLEELELADGRHYFLTYRFPIPDETGLPYMVGSIAVDITARRQAEMAAAWQAALVAGINRILREALTCETEEELGRTCLDVAEELTDSRFGFIDLLNEAGNLDFLTVSDPGWEACRMSDIVDLSHLKNIRPKGLVAVSLRERKALIANDPTSHPDAVGTPAGHPALTAYLRVPLTYGGQIMGVIGVGNKTGGYNVSDRETMEILAPAMVEALRHHQAEKDLRRSESKLRFLADQLLTAQENERKRLASELHDELGHALLALKLALGSIGKELLPTQEDLKRDIQDQLEYINEVINDVRRLYHDLSPGNVEDLGLTKALRTLIEDFAHLQEDIDWEVDLADLDRLFSLPVQTIIYRLVQEALTNIGKHAQPERVKVSAAPEDGRVHFVIQDDGVGFVMEEVLHQTRGLGLVAMEERVNMVGGTFTVWSNKKEGTKISFAIPARPPEERG